MSDLTVRDPSRGCEHGSKTPHFSNQLFWCPGGREMVLRRVDTGDRSLYPHPVYVLVEDT